MSVLQTKASDPLWSTWVSASAGTGKTKILTDRVLRLLLQNVPFNKILCLTFTNAAANEMHERIITQCEKWSYFSKKKLVSSLRGILGKVPTENEVIKASSLLSVYLKSQEQINICTVHSFCQRILKKFPLEAKISPYFKVIDQLRVNKIIKDIKSQIFIQDETEFSTDFFIKNFHELVIDHILYEILPIKSKILFEKKKPLTKNDLELSEVEYIKSLAQHKPNISIDEVTNLKVKNLIISSLGPNITSIDVRPFFLTLSGRKRKKLMVEKKLSFNSELYAELRKIQDLIYKMDQEKKEKILMLDSRLIEIFARKLILEFEAYKAKNAFLDYDDLIFYTQNLFMNSSSKEWVLYKLDTEIDHLLIDEAQDISKEQWNIIESLVCEFYSGDSKTKKNRTVFIVGDTKQSIFSFQGADTSAFFHMQKFLEHKLKDAKKNFQIIELHVSYRSTKEILTCVNNVFTDIIKDNPQALTASLVEITPYRNSTGLVQLWPLCNNQKNYTTSNEFWPLYQQSQESSSKAILAQKISEYVKEEVNSGKVLPSSNEKISLKDFLILFRTRDDFTNEIINAFCKAKIDITGPDIVPLASDLGVADLIAVGKFVLDPDDDLNLAALIKSPFFEVSECNAYKLVVAAKAYKLSLWQYIQQVQHYFFLKKKLKGFLTLYYSYSFNNFFFYVAGSINYRESISKSSDSIDEFLRISNDYFFENGNSLQRFIYWFLKNRINKKESIELSNKVRIMTVHSSKGLQAPIVILCDTTKVCTINSNKFFWDNDRLLLARSSRYAPASYEELKKRKKQDSYEEYLRLLYVAMTRAQDHLIVCGYQTKNKNSPKCWYELVKRSLIKIGSVGERGFLYYGKEQL